MSKLYVLNEHACGYSLFNVKEFEDIGTFIPAVQKSINDVVKFKSVVKLIGFMPFTNATVSLNNVNAISEGIVSDELRNFLEMNFPKKKASLGVCDSKLASAIGESLKFKVKFGGVIPEILRGIKTHMASLIKELSPATISQAELGLAHSYSRMKVKYNINKVDTMITNSIALLDQLDKDINLFVMRIREWYSYHFPELAKIVTDNKTYSNCVHIIGDRVCLTRDSYDELEEVTRDSSITEAIFEASKMSMGMDISPIDLINIKRFANRVVKLSEYKIELAKYLKSKMNTIAPNLSAIIGEVVGARLISHAGSLINLAKVPASTVQILGAEKALFRAIKTRTNTPKYGLIYHSKFISKAGPKNKGRISRFLANKCSLATRIDCFSDDSSNVFGEKLRDQVEERLNFYETGEVPRKNTEVMLEAMETLQKRAKKKRKHSVEDFDESEPPKKKKKKEKKEVK